MARDENRCVHCVRSIRRGMEEGYASWISVEAKLCARKRVEVSRGYVTRNGFPPFVLRESRGGWKRSEGSVRVT